MRNVLTADDNCNNYFYQDEAHKIEGDKHRQEVVFDKGGFAIGLPKTATSLTINPEARQGRRKVLNRLTARFLRTGGKVTVCPSGKRPDFKLGKYKSPSASRGTSRNSDLSARRWFGPILDKRTERELVRKAKSGDDQAKQKLVESFNRLVLSVVSQYSGPPHNDLMAAGLLGFWEAITRFNENRGYRLSTYADHWIRKYVRLEIKDWHREGGAGETRQDRYVFSNPNASPEQVVAEVGGSLKDAERAVARYGTGHDKYDTGEQAFDEDGNYTGQKIATSHEMLRLFDALSRFQLSPPLKRFEPARKWIDELARHYVADRKRRLDEVGPRQHALDLVTREGVWIGYRSKENRYRYRTTADISDRAKIAARFYTLMFVEQFPNKPATSTTQQYELDARIIREKNARLRALRLAQPPKESKSERKRKRKEKWRNTQVTTTPASLLVSQSPPTSLVPHAEFAKKTFGQSHICAERRFSAI